MKRSKNDLHRSQKSHRHWHFKNSDSFYLMDWKFSSPDFEKLSELQNRTPEEARTKNSVYEERAISQPYIAGDWWYATQENRMVYFVLSTPAYYSSIAEMDVQVYIETKIREHFGIPLYGIRSRQIHRSNLYEWLSDKKETDIALEKILETKSGINAELLLQELNRINKEEESLQDIKIRWATRNDFLVTIPNAWYFDKTYEEIFTRCLEGRSNSRPYISKEECLENRIVSEGIFEWNEIQNMLRERL